MKQLYSIAIGKLLDAGFHERYGANGEPETKLWIKAVADWLKQYQKMEPTDNSVDHQYQRHKRIVIHTLLTDLSLIVTENIKEVKS